MEIPPTLGHTDYLFQFSPESPSSSQEPGLVEVDQTSVARDSQLPVRGTVASSKVSEVTHNLIVPTSYVACPP